MRGSNQILAYIKGQIEAISGEMEDNRFMTSETRRGITARLEVLKDLQKWIESKPLRDQDIFEISNRSK